MRTSIRFIGIASVLALSACTGGTPTRAVPTATLNQKPQPLFWGAPTNSIPSGQPTPTPTPSPTPSNTENLRSPIEKHVDLFGYNDPQGRSEQTVSIRTRKTLKIKFVAEEAQNSHYAEETAFAPKFSKMSIAIRIGTDEQFTPLLNTGLYGHPGSVVIDLSNSFQKVCADDQADCSQWVQITFSKPNYDYWCFNWSAYCSSAPYSHVHSTHWVSGQAYFETDFTTGVTQ